MASLALPSARPWRAMGMRIDLRGARAARRACAALCAAVGGRRAAADVDRLLVAIVCWWRTGDAGGAEDRRRAPATTGHRAAACDQHDTRRHTATSLMLLLLLRPPAAPRGSATGCSPKHGAERSAVKGTPLTFMAPIPRVRARGGAERRAPPADRPAIRATRWRRLLAAVADSVLAKFGWGRTLELRRSRRTLELGRSRRTLMMLRPPVVCDSTPVQQLR